MVLLLLLSAFILGALTVVAVEAVGLWVLIHFLNRKVEREEIKAKEVAAAPIPSPGELNPSLYQKQGSLWVLEPEKVPKSGFEDREPAEPRKKKDILEVSPVRKYARIKDHYLILLESNSSSVEILLKGCTIVAVSATSLSSRKWAKRYPIKVESKDSAIYKGHKVIYVYLETSWEKESWCKALRLASCDDEERFIWFSNWNVEFQNYLASLNAGYPSFMKPATGLSAEMADKSVKLDHSSSKVRHFLKKLAKKAAKGGQDYKAGASSVSCHEERKINEKHPKITVDDTSMKPSISTATDPSNGSQLSGVADADVDHNNFDEGPLCLNLLVSRLFFDAKNNLQIRSSIQNRIQRTLSNMRLPSYVGEVTCRAVDPGTLPPHILAMRALPSDMNELLAMEIDLNYLGGMVLQIETRLEIQELEFEGGETRMDMNSAGEIPSDLLEGFEYLEEQFQLSEEANSKIKQKTQGDNHTDETENTKSPALGSSQVPRWKSLLHSITKHVSQVPLSLKIRISSVCGTMQLRIKPPPSDQIWFGFTSMPDIQFDLESSAGDHKITSGRLALYLTSRFKTAIRETLVLPNSVSAGVPWMIADKDDWVPKRVAPFMWYKNIQDSAHNTTEQEVLSLQPGHAKHVVDAIQGNPTRSEVNDGNTKNVGHIPPVATHGSLEPCASSSSSVDDPILNDGSSFQEIRVPLLKKDKMLECDRQRSIESKVDTRAHPQQLVLMEGQLHNAEDDDTKPRRVGTRERMLGLGKKMGEKLEVKRRHFEEKGRSFVEKMRGP